MNSGGTMTSMRAMVSTALVSLLLASCGDNEFPTEPIKSQRASAEAPITGEEAGSLDVASSATTSGGELLPA
jgi:hypothetical protein